MNEFAVSQIIALKSLLPLVISQCPEMIIFNNSDQFKFFLFILNVSINHFKLFIESLGI